MAKSVIIVDLANGNVDLSTALKRTKVLLSELGNNEVIDWINCEICGYPNDADLPAYRRAKGSLIGSYIKGSMAAHMSYSNVPLPLGSMPEEDKAMLLSLDFHDGVDSLRHLMKSADASNAPISKTIPADCFPAIAHYNNDPFMCISSANVVVSPHFICDILSTVENKLLDVLLLLEGEFGVLDGLDIDIDSKTPEQMESLSNSISILVFEDNSVTIGDGNTFKNSEIKQ